MSAHRPQRLEQEQQEPGAELPEPLLVQGRLGQVLHHKPIALVAAGIR
ncbi:hypothetical protein [Paenibacillus dendritiformis]|nr:hypothetical protein [Paenibacillus dendritiformis]